ncbi:MAG: Holliday junction branch migration DNA helicase RuvB [Deltaproteobacteria bacterium]|mgnify:CR=1 FL=1|nr:MAG: Holliday junction branch migration DNA helicase RuvB [Deltaproteobacteria bacterium]
MDLSDKSDHFNLKEAFSSGSKKDLKENKGLKEEWSLRPQSLSEYIGQRQVVEALSIAILAAKKRNEPLDHIIFQGPPGLGKTTLATIVAKEMGVRIHHTSGPALEKGGDLVSILTSLERGDILFIDEIHRLPKVVEELLCPAMEDFAVDIIFDKGANARTYRSRLEWFTLIGATTRPGLLSRPLRERFGIIRELGFYEVDEIAKIIKRSAAILQVTIDDLGAQEISRRSRGTPRVANHLLKRVRDYSQVKAEGKIDKAIAQAALSLEGVDNEGLTILDRRFLNALIRFYNGGPAGIEAIAATLQEDSGTLEELVEPFLLQKGYLIRTSSGRRVTQKAYSHLNLTPPNTFRQPQISFIPE